MTDKEIKERHLWTWQTARLNVGRDTFGFVQQTDKFSLITTITEPNLEEKSELAPELMSKIMLSQNHDFQRNTACLNVV